MKYAIAFNNFGPYHLARLRALALRLNAEGGSLVAYETAGTEAKYAWQRERGSEPFRWVTLFPGAVLEDLSADDCRRAMIQALDAEDPDAVGIVGYVRPESLGALWWCERRGRPSILMSESQAIDRPRTWWKEAVKRRRVRRFTAALVGGPAHRDYLVDLGMPSDRIALGYNAVDHAYYEASAAAARAASARPGDLPSRPYFLCVARYVPEKNLETLVRAFARYRSDARAETAWDLVICGDGPQRRSLAELIARLGCSASVHQPGFLQVDELPRWYAFAGTFVLPSRSEPWGLVANEAAACGLPLLISDRCGCAQTLVPDPPGTTGWHFDPNEGPALQALLGRIAELPESERLAMGRRALRVASDWGPERFATGTMEALALARGARRRRFTRHLERYHG